MGKTDWKRLQSMTEAEIEKTALVSEGAKPTDADYWKDAKVVMPESATKQSITIRVSPKVLSFFQKDGSGYQKRINAVLESYVDHELGKQDAG